MGVVEDLLEVDERRTVLGGQAPHDRDEEGEAFASAGRLVDGRSGGAEERLAEHET